MKVDMSPAAVTARIRMMGDLWLLSVKLMNSRKVKGPDAEIGRSASDEEQPQKEAKPVEHIETP